MRFSSVRSSLLAVVCALAGSISLSHLAQAALVSQSPPALSCESAVARLEMLGMPSGPGAFARAVATRQAALLDLCFAAQWDINAPDEFGRSPLLVATLLQDWTTVRRLLAAGARPELADGNGLSPLMAAALHGESEILRALLDQNASPNFRDQCGRSAIHYAVAAGHLEAVELLLPLSAGLELPCQDGTDLLSRAFAQGNERVIQTVLRAVPAKVEWTPYSRQALNRALNTANHEQIRLLLGKHPKPPTPEGRTIPLLAYAIAMNNAPLVQILLADGADPETVLPAPCEPAFLNLLQGSFLRHYVEEDSGVTVLMLAAGLGKADFVKTLLAAGAQRNRPTAKHKMLALYFASRTDDWQSTQLLLGNGPSPDQLRVEVSLSSQQAVVFKNGSPIFTTECSTGRTGFSTPAGKFVITDKNRSHRSTIYKVPMPFFMRLSCRDFGMHEGDVPDYPASHGCIRLPSAAARRFFSEIPVGTLVTIN